MLPKNGHADPAPEQDAVMPVTHMHPVYHAWHCGATDGTMCTDDRSVTCPDCRARIDEPMRAAISKCGGWQWWQAGPDKVWIIAPTGDAGKFCRHEFGQVIKFGHLQHGSQAQAIENYFWENF